MIILGRVYVEGTIGGSVSDFSGDSDLAGEGTVEKPYEFKLGSGLIRKQLIGGVNNFLICQIII